MIGDYVPYRATGRGKKEGDPVPGYFPPVIDPDTFYAAQGELKTPRPVSARPKGETRQPARRTVEKRD